MEIMKLVKLKNKEVKELMVLFFRLSRKLPDDRNSKDDLSALSFQLSQYKYYLHNSINPCQVVYNICILPLSPLSYTSFQTDLQ